MNRRDVLSSIVKGVGVSASIGSASTLVASCSTSAEQSSPKLEDAKKPMLMKVGCQHGGTGKDNLEFLARHGVFNMDGGSPKFIEGVGWDLDDAMAKRDACEKYGISLDA